MSDTHAATRARGFLSPFLEALAACAACGAIGVITGLAAAILLDEESTTWFFAVLLFTAVLSYFFDWMKGVIEGHDESPSPAQILFNYIVLVFFELLVASIHKLVAGGLLPLKQMGGGVVGRELAAHSPALISVVAMVAAWTLIGGAIGAALIGVMVWPAAWPSFMRSADGYWASARRRGLTVGALTGAIFAPVAVMVGIFGARASMQFIWMFRNPSDWLHYLDAIAIRSNIPWWGMPPALLDLIAHAGGRFGPGLTITAALVVFVVSCYVAVRESEANRTTPAAYIASVFIFGLPFVFLWPIGATFVRDFRILLTMAGLVALIWTVPSMLLGFITPYLNRESEHPRAWAWIAFTAGGCLFLVAIFDRMPRMLLIGGAASLFFVLGRLFLNSSESRYYWPALAVSIAILIGGFTDLALRADLLSVENLSYGIVSQPIEVPEMPSAYHPSLPSFSQAFLDDRKRELAELQAIEAAPPVAKRTVSPPDAAQADRPPLAADDYLGQALRAVEPTPEELRRRRQEELEQEDQRQAEAQKQRQARIRELVAPAVEARERFTTASTDLRRAREGACEVLVLYENERYKSEGHPPPFSLPLPSGEAACEAFASFERKPPEPALPVGAVPSPVSLDTLDQMAERHDALVEGAAIATELDKRPADFGTDDPEVQTRRKEVRALNQETSGYEGLLTDRIDGQKRRLAGLFQVCVTGSVGFWLTLGLLAAWSIWNRRGSTEA